MPTEKAILKKIQKQITELTNTIDSAFVNDQIDNEDLKVIEIYLASLKRRVSERINI